MTKQLVIATLMSTTLFAAPVAFAGDSSSDSEDIGPQDMVHFAPPSTSACTTTEVEIKDLSRQVKALTATVGAQTIAHAETVASLKEQITILTTAASTSAANLIDLQAEIDALKPGGIAKATADRLVLETICPSKDLLQMAAFASIQCLNISPNTILQLHRDLGSKMFHSFVAIMADAVDDSDLDFKTIPNGREIGKILHTAQVDFSSTSEIFFRKLCTDTANERIKDRFGKISRCYSKAKSPKYFLPAK